MAALLLAGCVGAGLGPSPYATLEPGLPQLALNVDAFSAARVPVNATCDGADGAPQVFWGKVPDRTAELFLDLFDRDAGEFSHWLVYGIPSGALRLPPLPAGATEGINGFGNPGYEGPCPPRGTEHSYTLRLVAVGAPLRLGPRATRADLYRALRGVPQLASASLSARYRR